MAPGAVDSNFTPTNDIGGLAATRRMILVR
jgi:hypothetical protein